MLLSGTAFKAVPVMRNISGRGFIQEIGASIFLNLDLNYSDPSHPLPRTSQSRTNCPPTIRFESISDDDHVLAHSPMVKGAAKILDYVADQGPIGLTESKGFKRHFVNWAAREFAWPDWTEEDLFRRNKVLNEYDLLPLVVLHDILIQLKIGRHYKNAFHVTKAGQQLIGRPGALFGILTPFYLFEANYSFHTRLGGELLGSWDGNPPIFDGARQ